MAKIGFIGLGKMGLPMTRNLLAAGHEIKAFDLMPENVAAAVEAGAAVAGSIAEAWGFAPSPTCALFGAGPFLTCCAPV